MGSTGQPCSGYRVCRKSSQNANPDYYNEAELADLRAVLQYTTDDEKTERQFYTTGINCIIETAHASMVATKKRFGKTGGNLAYHAYQSFKPNEVSPEQCHEIGIELAKRIWGDRYEVVVTTHLNTQCCHNHFVINSVSFIDGKKLNNNFAMYFKTLRAESDRLCAERGLSVIKSPATTHTPRHIHIAEKKGEPTRYNIFRRDIDYAISRSLAPTELGKYLTEMGYVCNTSKNRKHWTIALPGDKRCTRMSTLGEDYTRDNIAERIVSQYKRAPQAKVEVKVTKVEYVGTLHKAKRKKGLYALYIRYCYMLGKLPKGNTRKPMSPEMKMELRKFDSIARQSKFLCKYRFKDLESVQAFSQVQSGHLLELESKRRQIYNKSRKNPTVDLIFARDTLTNEIKLIRHELRCANEVVRDTGEKLRILRRELHMRNDHQRGREVKQRYQER